MKESRNLADAGFGALLELFQHLVAENGAQKLVLEDLTGQWSEAQLAVYRDQVHQALAPQFEVLSSLLDKPEQLAQVLKGIVGKKKSN